VSGGFTVIDLSQLPPPSVVESLDYEGILQALKDDLQTRDPVLADFLALESEPLTKLLEVCAYRELLLRQRVNDAARSVMLAYAADTNLDHLAALLGAERQNGEGDDRLRERAQLALEGLSTAGPVGAYQYHARSAADQVLDVDVSSPSAGEVLVTILARDGDGTPAQADLDAVLAALNDETVRPLCDSVTVQPAEIVTYAITATLEVLDGPDSTTVLAAALAAAQAYADAARGLGQGLTLSGLYAALHQPGVRRATIVSPAADVAASPQQSAYCTALDVGVIDG
jgi:phage-related baseplate assembly protein